MQDSHTPAPADEAADHDRLRLVPTATLGLAEQLAGRLDGHLARFAEHLREGLLAASTAVGLDVMAELMAAEVTDLAGPKGKHNPARVAKRHGSQDGTVTLGGRRVPVRRPRVRTVGDDEYELSLESYATFTSADLLADGVVARMLGGLSTRGYPVGLEPVGARVEQTAVGTSRSAVSRRFVTATAERLDQLLHRPLGEQRWLVVFLDGFGMGEQLLVGALGVTADGTKVPLGVVEGTTENTAVCTRLVTGLRDRGLDAEGGVLFVLDGGKALGAAVRAVFGAQGAGPTLPPAQGTQRHRPLARGRAAAGATPAALGVGQSRPRPRPARAGSARPRPGPPASRRRRQPARGLGRDPDRQPARRGRQTAADRRVDQPGGEHDRDRPRPRRAREALVLGRDGPALGGSRDARRRSPVPPRQGLPGATPARRRARTCDRRRARPRRHRLTVGSVMEAPPKSNGERDILKAAGSKGSHVPSRSAICPYQSVRSSPATRGIDRARALRRHRRDCAWRSGRRSSSAS